jgi:aryl-alcohol dehydrogenase-like predicted oxidoreductase
VTPLGPRSRPLTRRDLLKAGLALGAPLVARSRPAFAQQEPIRRKIPSTGQALPVIGIGTARRYDVGTNAFERDELKEVLRRFGKAGGGVIDTAPSYGSAESVVGDLVKGQYPEFEKVIKTEALDFVQVDYALDDREAADRIIPLAADRGAGVMVNLPFGRGRLFQAVRSTPLPEWARDFDCQSWAQFFLKYVVSHPAVTCAIPGTAQTKYLSDNLGAGRGRLPDATMRTRMAGLIDRI